jgi:hypothetical protein
MPRSISESDPVMTTAHASTAFFTAASLVLAGLLLLAFHFVMWRSTANRCIAGFVAGLVASPLMLVAHPAVGIAMAGVGVACAVPACVLAEDHGGDGGHGRGGSAPVDDEPSPGSDPGLWDEFERDFRAYAERERVVVRA